jgi:phosphoribosylaminoimidazole-succinocarboxamide synthase
MNVSELILPGIPKVASGKVREIFDLGESLLLVATDRISAFDCILPDPIPQKGALLTRLSEFWFQVLDFVPNHLLTARFAEFPAVLQPFARELENRSMIVRKASPLPVECVVRGYLAGSGWKEYRESGTVGGQVVPPGLRLADALPEPLFTPSTKAVSGHDENITWKECRQILGDELALAMRQRSIELYEHGRDLAAQRGIIIADTKFEFGLVEGELLLIDEVLTPDSSRFWPSAGYQPGSNPPSFDKQFVRDYLESLDWDKKPPAPSLPPEVIARTAAKYVEAYETLTGRRWAADDFTRPR